LRILYNWLFRARYDVTMKDIVRRFVQKTGNTIYKQNIDHIERVDEFDVVYLKNIKDPLYWPIKFSRGSLRLIINETANPYDWHHYEHETTPVHADDVVVDLGAADGLFSLNVVNRCRKVIMIEPNPLFGLSLEKTFKSYIAEQKAVLLKFAAGSIEKRVNLFDNGGSSTVDATVDGNCIMCPLDALLAAEKDVNYIKADVEGAEMDVLQGAREVIKKHKPKMAITCYHPENDPDAMITLVKSIVPEYMVYRKGVTKGAMPKPMMLHFYR
jgi:FkbM family methyltransferase